MKLTVSQELKCRYSNAKLPRMKVIKIAILADLEQLMLFFNAKCENNEFP